MSAQINKKYTIISIVLAAVLLAECIGLASASRPLFGHIQTRRSMRAITEACQKSFDGEFGHADVKTMSLKNFKGTISVPCKLRLKPGSSIQLKNVDLQTKSLLIEDQPGAKRPAHIIINDSQFTSSQGGFQIRLITKGSSVEIKKSKLDYPLSVGLSTGETDQDTKSSIELRSNQLSSTSEASEGIVVVSTGRTTASRNVFKLKAGESALILGSSCELTDNLHANDRCNGP